MRRNYISYRGIDNKQTQLGIETLGNLNISLMCSTGAFRGVKVNRSITNTIYKAVRKGWKWICS